MKDSNGEMSSRDKSVNVGSSKVILYLTFVAVVFIVIVVVIIFAVVVVVV